MVCLRPEIHTEGLSLRLRPLLSLRENRRVPLTPVIIRLMVAHRRTIFSMFNLVLTARLTTFKHLHRSILISRSRSGSRLQLHLTVRVLEDRCLIPVSISSTLTRAGTESGKAVRDISCLPPVNRILDLLHTTSYLNSKGCSRCKRATCLSPVRPACNTLLRRTVCSRCSRLWAIIRTLMRLPGLLQ